MDILVLCKYLTWILSGGVDRTWSLYYTIYGYRFDELYLFIIWVALWQKLDYAIWERIHAVWYEPLLFAA